MNYIISRLPKKQIYLSLLIGIAISLSQFINMSRIDILDSPYTRWLGVDSFGYSAILFYLLLPIISAIPASTLLKKDINSGFIYKLKNKYSISKIFSLYAGVSFITGAAMIAIPLLLNLIIWFTLAPNNIPDNLLNINVLIFNKNTLLVPLYYSHPLLHSILAIIFASIWGGLFALFSLGVSLKVKNIFVGLSSGLILQVIILVLNATIKLPDYVSYSPADFLHETSPSSNIDGVVILVATIIMGIIVEILIELGKRNVE
ncbi:hypothetical protein [Lactobacillus sp. LL6]|uniref:hypothetical protein n=1 Tax=Lactobacillus sp. LL6 TaxID=2596827 RepID=UPI0011867461|nr:hypothetical protein [Lactobacillus sp. LL6]TSO26699.1 hypothetical protein FOD82_06455 [Lactobacillus sp. LL6]